MESLEEMNIESAIYKAELGRTRGGYPAPMSCMDRSMNSCAMTSWMRGVFFGGKADAAIQPVRREPWKSRSVKTRHSSSSTIKVCW